ncbi:GNAT family N-acetyltransferase [Arsenicicoccus dermatophilus]|uniref:GNAT family N-acetyltransferase n=1 Tax=Arsenicicoccus dermatophilus TaxID=1076331 RepID=UPI00391764CA
MSASERVVRPARPQDVVALVDLRRVMFEAMGAAGADRAPWQKAAGGWFRAALDDEDVLAVVADLDGEVVASALGQLRRGCPGPATPTGVDMLLSSVATAPGRRCQGHARACVDAVLAWARERGADRVELFTTAEAAGIYEVLGFRSTDFPALRVSLVR